LQKSLLKIIGVFVMKLNSRPRRNRKSQAIRSLLSENRLSPNDFVLPVFICEGQNQNIPIESMPGIKRESIDILMNRIPKMLKSGLKALALFPVVPESKKSKEAMEALNPKGLAPELIYKLKTEFKDDLVLFSDIALDPFNSDGHDGLVDSNGTILNDKSVEILTEMALVHAQAGVDYVAPSDMMDGRIGAIRSFLDEHHYENTGILSYSAKYASAFYGPFRDALDSAPKSGDKKTYQMNPANSREAIREFEADIQEGADLIMVKPALAYLDIIQLAAQNLKVPVAAYQVSGEYAMIMAAAERGWLNQDQAMLESLLSIKRAGAELIFSYFAERICAEL
jgi:porphobilinogen synthase